jgi:hypothetical protein
MIDSTQQQNHTYDLCIIKWAVLTSLALLIVEISAMSCACTSKNYIAICMKSESTMFETSIGPFAITKLHPSMHGRPSFASQCTGIFQSFHTDA